MLSVNELTTIAKEVGKSIGTQLVAIIERLTNLEATTKDLQKQIDNLPEPVEVENPLQVTLEQIQTLLEKLVEDKFAAIDPPRDGKDGESVSLDDLSEVINTLIDAKFSTLHVPEDGEDGADGVSVTIDDIKPLVEALVTEAVSALPAAKDGTSVSVEDVTPLLSDMVSKAVSALPAAKDGTSVSVEDVTPLLSDMVSKAVSALPAAKDGRDAVALEVLPGIDFNKSYLRGTYATHDGGLWRAHSNTQGDRGWECIVDGVKSVEVSQENERSITVSTISASGKTSTKSFAIPVLIYKGVYTPDGEYLQGDTVTWGGSLWHTEKDNPIGKPGELNSEGWKLAVRKGRDGKDGVNGIDKTLAVKI